MQTIVHARWARLAPVAFLLITGVAVLSACVQSRQGVCPRVAIVDRLSTLTRFVPGAPETPQNIMFTAEIVDIKVTCQYFDQRTNLPASIEAETTSTVTVRRGPAMRGGRARFKYFVLVTDRRGTILNKKIYSASVRLGSGAVRYSAESGQSYDTSRGGTGLRFETWIGFQLTEKERRYNDRRAEK